MSQKLGIKLRKLNRICPITGYKEANIKIGASVVVLTDRGTEIGEIIGFKNAFPKTHFKDVRLKKVIRYANNDDIKQAAALDGFEKEAIKVFNKKIKEFELAIKSIDCEYTFDNKRVVFYFKVYDNKKNPNLKEITKDLAGILKARIEMKQLNPRDEAKLIDGLGPCGRRLCCSGWLEEQKHITVRMAKDQKIQISPTRTSGMCGRLLCCLAYEWEGNTKNG